KAYIKWLWMDNTDVQADWATGYGFHIPPRSSAASSTEPLKASPASDVVTIVQKYGFPEPELWDGAMGTALNDALDHIVKQGADPATEAKTAFDAIQKELATVKGS